MRNIAWAAAAAAVLAPFSALADDSTSSSTATSVASASYSFSYSASHSAHTGLGIVAILIFLVIGIALIALHFLPGIIASRRNHRNALAIWLVNIFLGWTLIGWVVALIWALN